MSFGSSSRDDDYASLEVGTSATDYLSDPNWPSKMLSTLVNEFQDADNSNAQDLLPCGMELIASLKSLELDPELVRPKLALGREWRRLYTDAVLLRCLRSLAQPADQTNSLGTPGPKETNSITQLEQAICQLDLTIILAGAPGDGRLDLVLSCISYIQCQYLPLNLKSTEIAIPPPLPPIHPLATSPVPSTHPPPSFSAFPSLAQRPFVLPGFASSWPATSRWRSADYLRSCAGRGRVVPVERGGDYRTDDWSVDLMPWDEFLDAIGRGRDVEGDSERLYLAQHSLFTQFPKLRADIMVPDYVYIDPPATSGYTGPPGNDEQLVINAWCGGRGANSPAHTDPYHNIYVQVVGYKSIWLAPPEASPGMYAFNSSKPNSENANEPNRDPKREGMLGNTSSIDVFALSTRERGDNSKTQAAYPLFYNQALPLAQSTLLGPGDALIIPPGWWHAMRGVGGESFSVSFWF